METNLDDVYYQKYLQYKQKYLELKQIKNNLDGGGGLFGKKKGKAVMRIDNGENNREDNEENEDPDVRTSSLTDGYYLVFNLDGNIDLTKNYVQTNYNKETKTGISFIKKDTFINEREQNEKSYIIKKEGKNITCNIISSAISEDFNLKLQEMRDTLNINKEGKDDDSIGQLLETNCSSNYHNTMVENLKNNINKIEAKDITQVKNKEIHDALSKFLDDFKRTFANNSRQFFNVYELQKKELIQNLNLDQYNKYKETNFELADENQFNKNYSNAFLEILKTEINKTSAGSDVPEFNMILKIQNNYLNDSHYKFGEYINKNNISITPKYVEIVKELAERRVNNLAAAAAK